MFVGAVFQDRETLLGDMNSSGITGISYHREGKMVVSACGEYIRLIDCLSGTSKKQIKCYKYGVSCISYTHDVHSILHGSHRELVKQGPALSSLNLEKGDALSIRYLSLYDNKYLRVFRGHEKPVSSLAMNPKNDTFYSAATDDKIAIWDLNSPHGALAVIDIAMLGLTAPSIDVDSKGMVFSVIGTPTQPHRDSLGLILQFDSRNYEAGPFAKISIKKEHILEAVSSTNEKRKSYAWVPQVRKTLVDRLSRSQWTGIESSPDGNCLLVKTDCAAHLVYDAFDGNPLAVLFDDDATFSSGTGARTFTEFFDPPSTSDAAFSPGGDYVVGGGDDGLLRIWKLPSFPSPAVPDMPAVALTSPQNTLEAHVEAVRHVRFNPAYAQACSACANTCLWLSPPS